MSATGSSYVSVLKDRGVVSVTGPDAEKLLGGLVTNDIALLEGAPAIYAALLAPQGKILFDFLVVKTADGFLLDTARDKAADLVKRLSLYKLRAQAEIRDVSDTFSVAALWGGTPVSYSETKGSLIYSDPRLPALGARILVETTHFGDVLAATNGAEVPSEAYHAHRIGLGVPEGGRDFAFGDTFPHEALLDQLNGVSFSKGCYVGQEVVSRMQHRTTVRKRVVPVVAEQDLPAGPLPVLVGEAEIGRLGSVAGPRGLALLRLDRVAEARRDGVALTVNGVKLAAEVPAFATFEIGLPHETA
ncbi:folate-binding protein [Hyphomicrobium sp. LHD-15]|uniref:CAF17-like 4Fe-4S cluster assembly/insertion protein YgfZ n=1 Tax=Hyphomicrobium sp. LHD-15 TaxID=3072142 RepID=UPI00280DBA91|nr:folate-binding protein [Hyphomicrobium sp. LHD-15]MDQ8699429.1 folate-binding protein [Hyphomicrobium sp. LHD-15]